MSGIAGRNNANRTQIKETSCISASVGGFEYKLE